MGNLTLSELEKIADFYICDLDDILDENCNLSINKNIHNLDHNTIGKLDFDAISKFGKIVKNYNKMTRLNERIS